MSAKRTTTTKEKAAPAAKRTTKRRRGSLSKDRLTAAIAKAESRHDTTATLTGGAGIKHDLGKPRYDLLPPDSLARVVAVLTYGAEKYAPHNWRKGIEHSRLYAAAVRHLEAWRRGEQIDGESGQYHLAHAICCLLFALSADLGSAVRINDLNAGQPR